MKCSACGNDVDSLCYEHGPALCEECSIIADERLADASTMETIKEQNVKLAEMVKLLTERVNSLERRN